MADTDQNTDNEQQQPPPAPVGDKGAEQEQHVPYQRFKQVNDELKTLKQQLAALNGEKEQQQTAAKSLEDRLAMLEQERNQERAARQRLEVATRKKLPAELADRLQGDTPEALEADADRLLAFLKPATGPGVPPPGGGTRTSALDVSKMTPEQIRKARREGKL